MSESGNTMAWMSIREVAERWGVSYDTVLRDVKADPPRIPSLKISQTHKISREFVEAKERAAKQLERHEMAKAARRVKRYATSGTDHYPDC